VQEPQVIVLLLSVFVAALAVLARRVGTPYPIVLVIGGLALGCVPHMTQITLDPDLVFLVILPPLLFRSAAVLSWREFRFNLVSIAMLAFGLVAFTVACATGAAVALLPGFDWRLGLVLGAIVSTTDAIAATSIFQRFGLPSRMITTIEGESLVNDASGLVTLQLAVAIVVTGHAPGFGEAAGRLAYLIALGIPIGLAIAFVYDRVVSRLEDATIEITLSLVVPYVAYLAANALGTSGVLATIACGLYTGRRTSIELSSQARLTGQAVWDTLVFLLNGFVFVLVGLELPQIVARTPDIGSLIVGGLVFSGVLVAVRMVWMWPGAKVANVIRRRLLHQDVPMPTGRMVFLAGWVGMRGVLALAAALALPPDFPARDVIAFVTCCVIVVTLVVQGLALAPLIRWLRVAGAPEEGAARDALHAIARDVVAFLERERASGGERAVVCDELISRYRHQLALLSAEPEVARAHHDELHALTQRIRRVQRTSLKALHERGAIGDDLVRHLEHELDLLDAHVESAEAL
jgi:Na+/H+ antiporter